MSASFSHTSSKTLGHGEFTVAWNTAMRDLAPLPFSREFLFSRVRRRIADSVLGSAGSLGLLGAQALLGRLQRAADGASRAAHLRTVAEVVGAPPPRGGLGGV